MSISCKIVVCIFIVACSSNSLTAQNITILTSGTKISLRGLSVVDDRIIWVSGSNGTVGKSVDSGHTFKWMTVKNMEQTDFRDIEAFDENTAVIMGIATPAHILRTIDGGENWQIVFEDSTKGMFLDAMDFMNDKEGIVIGDPIDGQFFIAKTQDGGQHWKNISSKIKVLADSGEACFASSGTNITYLNKKEIVCVSGGSSSNIFIHNKKIRLPIMQGTTSTGANSIAVKNKNNMIVVGGDFNAKNSSFKNCFITNDGAKSWLSPTIPPKGYRSCVAYLSNKDWISCGLTGVDYSKDDGITWKGISQQSFHIVKKGKKGSSIFFAGTGGVIGKLVPTFN